MKQQKPERNSAIIRGDKKDSANKQAQMYFAIDGVISRQYGKAIETFT